MFEHTQGGHLMDYIGLSLPEAFPINTLYSVHFFEYAQNYSFPGERHNFWEFIYVDRGEVDITQGSKRIRLLQNEIAFHAPDEFHDVHATGCSAPNLIVISFSCFSPRMYFFKGKVLSVPNELKILLGNVIREARRCINGPLNDPLQHVLTSRRNSPPMSLAIIRMDLEIFLIRLYQYWASPERANSRTILKSEKITTGNEADRQFKSICAYLDNNIGKQITIAEICHDNMISSSQLYYLFHKMAGMGVIEYFLHLKIRTSRNMIRESGLSLTQISEQLGFSSLPYFSRQFKKICSETPSQYAKSVKALTERSRDI